MLQSVAVAHVLCVADVEVRNNFSLHSMKWSSAANYDSSA